MENTFDVWMCTHNSEKLLPHTLKRIEQVISSEAIERKFIIDDFSTDNSKIVAEELGWEVYENKKRGLYNAREYAFSLVKTAYCASFEHDVYLSKKWFPRIPNIVMKDGYDVAQGIRIRDAKGFKELDTYDNNHRNITSEDNTFYSMESLKKTKPKYFVDKTVCSNHIRGNVINGLRHSYSIYHEANNDKLSAHLKCLMKSLVLSIKVAKETKACSVIGLYPLERLMILSGALTSKRLKLGQGKKLFPAKISSEQISFGLLLPDQEPQVLTKN